MSDTFHWDDTTTVSRDGVTVERELEGREDGIIVTMDLHADVSGPLTVEVLDEFPADLPARQAGFNVEYEPDDGDLSLERARIRHTIDEESARIVYAIRLAQPVDAVAFDDPSIVDVALPGLSGGDDSTGESMTRGGDQDGVEAEAEDVDGAGADPDAGSEGSGQEHVAFDATGFESRSATDHSAESAPDEGEAADTAEATDAPNDPADGPSVDGASAPDGADDGQTGAAGPDAEAIERAVAETERSSGEASGGTDDEASPDDASADEVTTADGPVDRDASGVDPAHPEQTPRAASQGSTDASGAGGQGATSGADPATGEQSDPAGPAGGRDAPADAGGGAETGGPGRAPGAAPRGTPTAGETGAAAGASAGAGDEMSRSVRLRLDRLNARVEEFATYAEALEDIIEREGTGPEIIENLESNLTETTERLESVRADVDDLQSAHEEDVATVRDRIDELEEELETARSDLRSDVVNVRGTVDDIGADVERVDHETSENAADVEELRDDVGAVRETVDDVAGDVERVDDATTENAEAVQSVREHLETVESAVHSLDDRVDDHVDELEGVGETVASVETDVAELTESVEAMRSDIESLQMDVDRLLRFREILSDVFGGPVQRATEESRDPDDRPGDGRQDNSSVSAPSEPSR